MKKIVLFIVAAIGLPSYLTAQGIFTGASLGLGTVAPGQRLHVVSGNILLDSPDEQALIVKRAAPFNTASNPIFALGRIVAGGDGDPEFRVLYSDDLTVERPVFEFDRKGIVASVKPEIGSHFEGFIAGQPMPLFRLNSFPTMTLEMGPGGTIAPDVAVRRAGMAALALSVAGTDRLTVDAAEVRMSSAYVRLPTISGGAPPATDCSAPEHAGRMVVRTDGTQNLYICTGASWIAK